VNPARISGSAAPSAGASGPRRKTLCLVDAHGYLHRAFHALPPLTNSRGEPVGALFGFLRVLLKILRQQKPDYLAVCFDSPGPTFRHKAYPAYKAHRKETDEGLRFQLPLARELVEAWGLPAVAKAGFEADDVIATLADAAEEKGLDVLIVTGDKDALQLVSDHVSVLSEPKPLVFTPEEVQKKYGLAPGQLVDFFAFTGDASDNVPGVPGVGEKTATQLLQKFKTLDGVYAHLDEIPGALHGRLRDNRPLAEMSRELVTLDRKAPVGVSPAECLPPRAPSPKFLELLRRFEFNSLLPEMNAAGAQESSPTSPAGRPVPPTGTAPSGSRAARRTIHVVLTDKALKSLTDELRRADIFAVDVETTGLDPFASVLVGVSLAVRPGEAWYVPVGHSTMGGPAQLSLERVRKAMAPLFADARRPKAGQNLKFDSQVLARHGMPLSGIAFDTLVGSYCLNPGRPAHGLKALALDFLGEAMTPIEALIGKGAKARTMDQVTIEEAAAYAGADAEVALRLKALMEKELKAKKLDRLFHEVEMPLVPILAAMEEAGVALDVPYLKTLSQNFARDIAGVEKEIQGLAGEPVNVNSPKQLGAILFEKLKLPVVRKTKTGFSTDEETLKKLSDRHPLPGKILVFRELAKLKSTYIDGLLEKVRESGRVHTRFNQAVAATGRLSSSDPNLQNIPIRTEHGRRIRRAFVPAPGCVFLSGDYSQIDLRVLAHASGDPALVKAFRHQEDIHASTARDIFGLSAGESVSEDQRRIAKSVNFGIVYGQTGYGLSQQLGIPMDKAQDHIHRYFEKYAGVKDWVQSTLAKARRDGFVTTLLKRVRYLPEINAANANVRGFAERTAMNTPIQGTSADIIKVAMRDLAALIERKGWKTRMILQVHDDLLFEVPRAELARVAEPLRKTMEGALKLDVPIVVDLKTGSNWAEMEPLRDA